MADRALSALARWGDQLRAIRSRRRTFRRRAAAVASLVAALGATLVMPPRPIFVWNVSASAPVGLYAVGGRGDLAVGDMVIAQVPARWRLFAARRHYIPVNVPLVKRVAALPGMRVCAWESWLWIEERRVAERRLRDGGGRAMPRWSGCVTLRAGTLLLLMDDPGSFDGRYFGVTDEADVVGRAVMLWTH
ncbi:MAG: S26 family signal peptidase [Sphingopyxis sp.]|nr:S26 family signal peptidase [Sphingopyxis sp.]